LIFSCTNKVIKRLEPLKQVVIDKQEKQLINWYVDQITFERKKHFLFTNSKTLFSFIIYFGTKKEILNFQSIFANKYKEQIIRLFGFNQSFIDSINEELRILKFCKTNNRSILGSMNDFKLNASSRIKQEILNNETLNSINFYLNQMPMGSLKYKNPFEIHKAELEKLNKF